MNPCPCGFVGDSRKMCTCDFRERIRYRRKISGPLLDRIDLHVCVPAVPWSDLQKGASAESSAAMRERVLRARRRAALRFPSLPAFRNADLPPSHLAGRLLLDGSARRMLGSAVERLHLSVRALHRALRVARTIADLADCDQVTAAHLAEAISFRVRTTDDGVAPSPTGRPTPAA